MLPDADAAAGRLPGGSRATIGAFGRRTRAAVMTYIGVLVVLAGLIVFFSATQPRFRTYDNFINILETNCVLLIVSVGLTFALLVGGFDLSIGGVVALSGVCLAKLVTDGGLPAGVAIFVVIVGALLFGLIANGVPIAVFGLNFFVVTLGVWLLAQGLAQWVSNEQVMPLYDEQFIRDIGNTRYGNFPVSVMIALFILLLGFLVTRYTGFGRMLYAVGGNPEAARLAGINVTAVRAAAYGICGLLAGVGGVVEAGRLASAAPQVDIGIALSAAAAVLLGGTSFTGGVGGVVGTLLGVAFLGVLQNGLIISSVAEYWQNVVTGAVLVASVALDRLRGRGPI
jgi:ribose transport system permease protein